MTKFKGFPPMNANFTPVPNAFFDYVLPSCPPCVVSVVGAIIRATLGWMDSVTGEKRIEAELSIPDIARLAKISENSVRKGVRQALEEGLLIETAPAGLNTGARYALRWEDEERQKEAIERARRATGDQPAPPSTFTPPSIIEGVQDLTPSKVEPLIKKALSSEKKALAYSEKNSLNVSEQDQPKPSQRSTSNEGGRGINAVRDKAVDEIVTLTGDESSRRRFWQLWEVAERNQSLDAWSVALRAVQKRQKGSSKQPLERPGAYFCTVLIQELEKREVFVPTNAEKLAEGDVGEVIRQGLFDGAQEEPERPEPPAAKRPVPEPKPPPASPSTPEELDAELAALDSEGGAALKSFQAFVSEERGRYLSELGTISQTARERLLTAFDRPEKRRDLFRRWREANK